VYFNNDQKWFCSELFNIDCQMKFELELKLEFCTSRKQVFSLYLSIFLSIVLFTKKMFDICAMVVIHLPFLHTCCQILRNTFTLERTYIFDNLNPDLLCQELPETTLVLCINVVSFSKIVSWLHFSNWIAIILYCCSRQKKQ